MARPIRALRPNGPAKRVCSVCGVTRFVVDCETLLRIAWKVAGLLGWGTTFDAEFVALAQLQADVFVTADSDLARAVSGLVRTATIDALRTA